MYEQGVGANAVFRIMIDDSEITFVIQGPYVAEGDRTTEACVRSIRQFFPDSPVIISTWQGSQVPDIYDHKISVVENTDPGAEISCIRGKARNNLNRQIVSTLNGLRAVKTRYAVKTRVDIQISGRDFLTAAQAYGARCDEFRVFEQRVTACKYYFRNPLIYRAPFHPSDIFLFGLTSDLLKLWDIPLTVEPEFSRWFENRPRPSPDYNRESLMQCSPEQYIWTRCLSRHGYAVELDSPTSRDRELAEQSNISIVNNFFFDSPKELGLSWTFRLKSSVPMTVFASKDFRSMYEAYCLAGKPAFPKSYVLEMTLRSTLFFFQHEFRAAYNSVRRGVGRLYRRVVGGEYE